MTTATIAEGRYTVEGRLGEGGMATVLLARDEELGRLVAIKLLAETLAGDAALRRRFVGEARHAARLAHPNVVAVFDAGEEAGRPYIVMEYVEGETLADALRRHGRLPVGDAVGLLVQACAGLHHAHGLGLVHRDVKPQNLLLRTDGVVKVADFGIAHAAGSSRVTELGTILGTAAYLAPEQARGEEVTAAADVYSLGAVAYELLTGRPPRSFSTLAELAEQHEGEPVPPLRELAPDVPEHVEDAVMRALARLSEYRHPSAAAFSEALAGAPAEAPTEALRGGATTAVLPRAETRRRRRIPLRAALAILAAVALLAVAAGVALTGPDDGGPPVVQPVEPGGTPEERARNLAEWLRARSAQADG